MGVEGVAAPDEFPDPLPATALALAPVMFIVPPGVLGPLGNVGVRPPICAVEAWRGDPVGVLICCI